jgi:hypothetical protein
MADPELAAASEPARYLLGAVNRRLMFPTWRHLKVLTW